MNRIKIAAQVQQFERELEFNVNEFSSPESAQVTHSLFVPLHYEKNYAYPLVIWLHEDGANERQLQRVMPFVSMRNYVAVAPVGVESHENGFAWPQTRTVIISAETAVTQCISLAKKRYHIATDRIFIAGAGAGGTMAFRIGLNHPDLFAGVLSFAGAMPTDQTPLADFKRCRKVPCFVSHGRESTQFDVDTLCSQLKLMYAAGFDVTVRQYPDGDQLNNNVLHDMNVWMMELVTGQRSDKPNSSSSSVIGNHWHAN